MTQQRISPPRERMVASAMALICRQGVNGTGLREVVAHADAPRVLEYNWGGGDLRWELEPLAGGGTRLTLWHNIDRGFISMGAAGWHICLDVLDRLLADQPIGRIVGPAALKFDGWQRLNTEYAAQFGVEPPAWSRPKS